MLSAQSFEVAAIKPSGNGVTQRRFPNLRNGAFIAQGMTLTDLLYAAYGKIPQRISGPDWMATDRFDISAKAPEGTADTELSPLLRSLLRERFHLETHAQMREMAIYEMTAAKDGVKLKAFDPVHPPNPEHRPGSVLVGAGDSSQLADALARLTGRPVVDMLKMKERLAYTLYYLPLSAQPTEAEAGTPDIFSAVQQQLGIRLDSKKSPIEVLVVDHADRTPAAN